jgi:two-component system NtrC family sensor kinase
MAKRGKAAPRPPTTGQASAKRKRAAAAKPRHRRSPVELAKENENLKRELGERTNALCESLQQQTATADVLKVISRSTLDSKRDLESVLETLLESAIQLCGATRGHVYRYDGEFLRFAAAHGAWTGFRAFLETSPLRPGRGSIAGRVALDLRVCHVPDILLDTEYEQHELLTHQSFRSALCVPMLREGALIGVITILKSLVEPFTDRQIELVSTFADQAVIAIENVRLFDEVRARTDDLRESLQQQTATADVLKVISRSAFDLQTVLNTLVESAVTLSGAKTGTIFQRIGDVYRLTASFGYPEELVTYGRSNPITPGMDSNVGRTALLGKVVQIPDVLADHDYRSHGYQRIGNFRAMLGIPLMRDGKVEGVFSLGKPEPGPFTKRQAELVQTFADQAVIAIENVRLFDQLKARTDDLSESLQQQTATADVLKVISRSTFDLQTVLQTLVESAARLCEADIANIWRPEGIAFRLAASFGMPGKDKARFENVKYLGTVSIEPGRGSIVGRVLLERRTVQVHDVQADPEYELSEVIRIGDYRTVLGVPLLREGVPIGVIFLSRCTVQPFTDKHIALVTTFADQAVIAIENVRLFDEVQARTEDLRESLQQQTATADVLKVISRSTFELETVLKTLVESAARLCEADKATITRQRDGAFYRAESFGFSNEFMEHVRNIPVAPDRGSATGRALLEGKAIHIPDVQTDPDYYFDEALRLGNYRTLLAVPMMREGTPTGVVTLTRSEARQFTDKQIELVTTFADQAAIAIENVRLFEQVQERTRELSQSLDDLHKAQDRLIQTEKLASLGQLTAGIAHEIKNPLNFVNNFSALSKELVDELGDALKPVTLDDKKREELDELTHLLKGNLEKVVQHGQRADSIVKNMLLHSREGSGERALVDLNAIVEDSLNLAYHGARAEKQAFNVRLVRSFDPAAGQVDLFPQEITRVLLNLISNGVYAAMKRKPQALDGYEPMLVAATRGLGNKVEIKIRDNGGGIAPEVKEKIFNPFFTTKPPGEGTGLGLSLSYDIIVKQHSGSIEVDTLPGEFTEVTVILPRKANLGKAGANS